MGRERRGKKGKEGRGEKVRGRGSGMRNPQADGCQGPTLDKGGPESRHQRQVNIAMLNLYHKRVICISVLSN